MSIGFPCVYFAYNLQLFNITGKIIKSVKKKRVIILP